MAYFRVIKKCNAEQAGLQTWLLPGTWLDVETANSTEFTVINCMNRLPYLVPRKEFEEKVERL